MVEGALIFVLGVSLLIGLLDIGQILFIHQTVVDRTNTAARWASVSPFDATQIKNMILYGTPSAGTPGSELFNMSASNISVAHDTSDGAYADRISIVVSGYSYLFFSGMFVNTMYGSQSQDHGVSSGPSVVRTGLTVTTMIPHEYVPEGH